MVNLRKIRQLWIRSLFLFRPVNNGHIHQVLIAGLEIAVQVSVPQNADIFLSGDIHVIFQDNLVLSQSSCLIRAEHIHGPEILNGIQILYDSFFPGHGYGSLRQTGSYDHRQHLGSEADCNRDSEQESLEPVALRKAVDEKYDGNHDQHETD